VFDDDAVLEHGHLGIPGTLVRRLGADLVAHHHHTFDGFASGQELGLAQDRRSAPPGIAAVAATLTLGFQPRRSRDALDLSVVLVLVPVPVLGLVTAPGSFVDDGVRRIVRRRVGAVSPAALAPAATATATGRVVVSTGFVIAAFVVGIVSGVVGLTVRLLTVVGVVFGVVAVLLATATAPTAATAPASPTGTLGGVVVGFGAVIVLVVIVVIAGIGLEFDGLRGDEEGHVLGTLHGGVDRGRLEDRPRVGFGAVNAFGRLILRGLDSVEGTVGILGDLSQPVGLGLGLLSLFRYVLCRRIVGHVFSSSPRARPCDAATRGLPLLARAIYSRACYGLAPSGSLRTHPVPG
jgi:hypothetical protein